jgi:hypothetical protein
MPRLHPRRLPRSLPGDSQMILHLVSTYPAQVQSRHLLLESPLQARACRRRRGWFTCQGKRAHGVSRAMGNHSASAWSAGVEPAQTHDRSCLPSFPALCPAAPHCWTAPSARLVVCRGDQQRTVDSLPPLPAPADTAQGRGQQGKVDGQVETRCIRQLSRCQDVIGPLWEDQGLYRYASCRPRGFCT